MLRNMSHRSQRCSARRTPSLPPPKALAERLMGERYTQISSCSVRPGTGLVPGLVGRNGTRHRVKWRCNRRKSKQAIALGWVAAVQLTLGAVASPDVSLPSLRGTVVGPFGPASYRRLERPFAP